mmetsp:Transcript_94600/g.178062  ORF Transcript_94600/g.178062 Transcript_94600/m.178062 type:complete len:205 (-) Transcript_94600:1663-2277(-)
MTRTPTRLSRISFPSSTAWHSAAVMTPAPPQSEIMLRCSHGAPPTSIRPLSPRPRNSLSSMRPSAPTKTAPHRAEEKWLRTICGAPPMQCRHVPQRPAAYSMQPTTAGSAAAVATLVSISVSDSTAAAGAADVEHELKSISIAAPPNRFGWSRSSMRKLRIMACLAPSPSKRITGTPRVLRVVSQFPSPSNMTGRRRSSVSSNM